jgi:hypothetical protein
MANFVVTGSIRFSNGTSVPLLNAAMAESATGLSSTAVELQTSAAYTVTAQSIGSYAQGLMMVAANIVSTHSVTNAYIDRQGLPLCFLPASGAGPASKGLQPTKRVVLQPGDKIMVCCAAAATRTMALTVRTNAGEERCFVGTTGGGDTTTLVDQTTGNGIGETLQKQTITQAICTSVDGIKITSGSGAVILNAKGAVVGSIGACDDGLAQPDWVPMDTFIDLNYAAQYITSA